MAKTYNTVKTSKIVDRKTSAMASGFLNSCEHLTPATEAAMDAMLAEIERNDPDHQPTCEGKPDIEYLAAEEDATDEDWIFKVEPDPEAFAY